MKEIIESVPRLEKPKNDWAKAFYILLNEYHSGISIAKVLTKWSPVFHKVQSRLGDIEAHYPNLSISHVTIPYTDKITGKKKHYTQYTAISPMKQCVEIYNEINKKGVPKRQ